MYADLAAQTLSKLSPEDRLRHPLGSELNGSSIEKFWQYKMDRHLQAPRNTSYTNFVSANYSIRLGQNEKALEYLEESLAAHEEYLPNINGNPNFDPVRFDPRFVNIVESAGLQK